MDRRERLIYLAGLIDGEGCIMITQALGVILTISMTDYAPVTRFAELFGCKINTSKRGRYRRQYRCVLCTKAAIKALAELAPFMLCKREQAMLILEHTEHFGQHSKRSTLKCRQLRLQLSNMKKYIRAGHFDYLITRMEGASVWTNEK